MPRLVKICGISTAEAMDAALGAGADMVGLVFFAKSPRQVTRAAAAALAERARGRARIVALTVDADDAAIDELVAEVRPDWLQLHGTESPERVAALKRRTGLPVMKALGVATADDLAAATAYAGIADRLLIDAKPPQDAGRPGGNGQPFDWRILAGREAATPFMLSGGLTSENVGAAIALLAPTNSFVGVDVSSGVEGAPGVKDLSRIRAFVAAARAASRACSGKVDTTFPIRTCSRSMD